MPRIISGRFKGLRLVAPAGRHTRPTADQVKEAIFSMLISLPFELEGTRVLDFFAGSGSLGLEALSRGAGSLLLTDCDRAAAQAVERNLSLLNSAAEVVFQRTRWPQGWQRLPAGRPFNLFLLDPPYEERELVLDLLKQAAARGLAAPGAVAVWEQSPDTLDTWSPEVAEPWQLLKTRAWGARAAAFLIFDPAGESESQPARQ